jgi:hypothetical protein
LFNDTTLNRNTNTRNTRNQRKPNFAW